MVSHRTTVASTVRSALSDAVALPVNIDALPPSDQGRGRAGTPPDASFQIPTQALTSSGLGGPARSGAGPRLLVFVEPM